MIQVSLVHFRARASIGALSNIIAVTPPVVFGVRALVTDLAS
jgi:hypothetical protein